MKAHLGLIAQPELPGSSWLPLGWCFRMMVSENKEARLTAGWPSPGLNLIYASFPETGNHVSLSSLNLGYLLHSLSQGINSGFSFLDTESLWSLKQTEKNFFPCLFSRITLKPIFYIFIWTLSPTHTYTRTHSTFSFTNQTTITAKYFLKQSLGTHQFPWAT